MAAMPRPPPLALAASDVPALLSAPSDGARLAAALSLPTSSPASLALSTSPSDAVALEYLAAAASTLAEHAAPPAAAARTLTTVYDLLAFCAASPGGWPTLAEAGARWDAALAGLLSPLSPLPEGADDTGSGDSPGSGSALTPSQAAAVDAWLRSYSFLVPHVFEMHRVLWTTGLSASPPLVRIVRPIVVPPPPVGGYEPLSAATEV